MKNGISIIIPAYNVEQYIEKCLDSILSQTYNNLEVIVINDGSTDNTAELIKKFLTDKRLKIINQKNAGVTTARNNGIEAATSEYLTFVDSDDYLDRDMYEKLYIALTKTGADVAVCDYNLIYESHTDYKYSNIKDETVDVNVPDYFYKYCACNKPNNYIWTRLYKTETVKMSGVRFENFKLGDDTLFNFKLLPYLKRITYISGSNYNYLQRRGSNVYTVAAKNNLAKVYADTFQELTNYYKANGFNDFMESMPIHAYTRLRSIMFYSRLANLSESEIVQSVKEGFINREIVDYLNNTTTVDKYAEINGLSSDVAAEIKRIMIIAAVNPDSLSGVTFP